MKQVGYKTEQNWRNLTSDINVLDITIHSRIEFESEVSNQDGIPFQKFNVHEEQIIENEIQKFTYMKVISEVPYVKGQFISPIFTQPKKYGKYHKILNLKELNKYINILS